jgi:hypothetical protein
MAVTRLMNVYPIMAITNMLRPARRAIKPATQHVTWFSGLRGGIAFALAMQAMQEFSCRVPSCTSVDLGPKALKFYFKPNYTPTPGDW